MKKQGAPDAGLVRILTLSSERLAACGLAQLPLVVVFAHLSELIGELSAAHPTTVVLLDALDADGMVRPDARAILDVAGIIPVVAWVEVDAATMHGVRELLGLGVSDVLEGC